MKQKTLDDYPDYVKVRDAVQALKAQQAEVAGRIESIVLELSQPRQEVDGQVAWECALQGEDKNHFEIDNRSVLREELLRLEGNARFIDEALRVGEMELDKIRGRISLEICATVRPQWIAEIKVILECLKRISESNLALDRMRAEIERNGIRSDSLPFSKFDIGGSWSDPFGGRVVGFQRDTIEHFPELTAAADMAIKSKLAALARREEQFNNQGAQHESFQTE
jgi:hypothetical protein